MGKDKAVCKEASYEAIGRVWTIDDWGYTKINILFLKGDFLGGPVVKNPPSNEGDMGSIPGQGTKIPRAAGQLNPHTTITEPLSHK